MMNCELVRISMSHVTSRELLVVLVQYTHAMPYAMLDSDEFEDGKHVQKKTSISRQGRDRDVLGKGTDGSLHYMDTFLSCPPFHTERVG